MNNASVNIYLVSMERDVERRKVIANQFPKHFANFNIIEAVKSMMAVAACGCSVAPRVVLRC